MKTLPDIFRLGHRVVAQYPFSTNNTRHRNHTYEKRTVKMVEIPADLGYEVDKKHLGKSFDPENAEHHTEGIVHGYGIYCTLTCYRTICKNRQNEDLWQIFHKDFEGFTPDIFKLGHRIAVRELREQLVMQEIWVKGPRGSISYAKAFQDCLDETTPAEWTEEATTERRKLMQSITTRLVASRDRIDVPMAERNSAIPAEVDKKHLGKSFDPENAEHHTEGIVNGCMLKCYRTIYKNRQKVVFVLVFFCKSSLNLL